MGKRRVEINIISAEGLKLSPSFGPVYPPSYPPPPPQDPVYPPSYPPPGYPSYGAPSSYDRDYHQPQSYGYGGNFQQQPPLGYGNLGPGYGQTQPNYYAPPPPPPAAAKSGHSNLALGAGIAAGALGGLVLGEVVEDIAENADDDDFE
ncbi:hypothetical protein SELMODRAFT_444587 [Selaginella moellendorffii]|uniref:Uncharacterized protein n=1 Tax=Selaginella moellendorffii TaxID=88036 RepID=D8SBB1_SELML|nr:hypothetical protein SELMODRAFT_444587 [Selaginella moellendorffii]